jgi:CRP-like cAMP-binding protein
MRFSGYLTPDIQVVDRRQRRLLATEKLQGLLRDRLRLHFTAMAPLFPDGTDIVAGLGDATFEGALVNALVDRFRTGFRPLHSAPKLGLFGERNAGILILLSLVAAGDTDDTVPPQRPVPVSIAALARRFAVSRPHVLKLMRDAESEGFIERTGDNQKNTIVILPRLADATHDFFASAYLFFADCAREALRAGVQRTMAAG